MSAGTCCPHDSSAHTPECSACGCNAFVKKSGSRIVLPFEEIRVDVGAESIVTIRPYQFEGVCRLRRLVCMPREPQFIGLKVKDVRVGRNSALGAAGPLPVEFFALCPDKLDQSRREAIEKSEFWENIGQAHVLPFQDISIVYLNFAALTHHVSAALYADEIKGDS